MGQNIGSPVGQNAGWDKWIKFYDPTNLDQKNSFLGKSAATLGLTGEQAQKKFGFDTNYNIFSLKNNPANIALQKALHAQFLGPGGGKEIQEKNIAGMAMAKQYGSGRVLGTQASDYEKYGMKPVAGLAGVQPMATTGAPAGGGAMGRPAVNPGTTVAPGAMAMNKTAPMAPGGFGGVKPMKPMGGTRGIASRFAMR